MRSTARNRKRSLPVRCLTLDNQIDTTTGTIKLKAIFDNKDDSLFPNQFVNARLLVDTQHAATLIPAAAIQRNGQGAFVYQVKPRPNRNNAHNYGGHNGREYVRCARSESWRHCRRGQFRQAAGRNESCRASAPRRMPIRGPLSEQSVQAFYPAAGGHVAVDGCDLARRLCSLSPTAHFGAAGSGLPHDSGADFLSRARVPT